MYFINITVLTLKGDQDQKQPKHGISAKCSGRSFVDSISMFVIFTSWVTGFDLLHTHTSKFSSHFLSMLACSHLYAFNPFNRSQCDS